MAGSWSVSIRPRPQVVVDQAAVAWREAWFCQFHGSSSYVPIRRIPPTAVRLTLFCVRTDALVSVGKDGGVDGDHHRG